MPRKFRAKTCAERARKFRRIHTLTDEIAKLEKILAEIALHRLIRYKLERILEKSHRQLARLHGQDFSKDTLNRISSRDQTVRSDGFLSKSAMKNLVENIGYDFELGGGCTIGTLVGAGLVINGQSRFRTPPWLFDKQRMKELWKHFRKTRRRTARVDIELLIAYYLFRRSDADLHRLLLLAFRPDKNGDRVFRVKRDKQGGYTNLQRYRERLVRIGYEFFKMEEPDWAATRREQRVHSAICGRGTDPRMFGSQVLGENEINFDSDAEREQGDVEDEAQRSLGHLEEKLREKEPGRAKRLEAERRELSPAAQEFDRQLQRQIDLAERGRVTALYNQFFGNTRNEDTEKSPTPMRSKTELSGMTTNSEEPQSLVSDKQQAA